MEAIFRLFDEFIHVIGGIDHPRDLALAELLLLRTFLWKHIPTFGLAESFLGFAWIAKSNWMWTGQPDEMENHCRIALRC